MFLFSYWTTLATRKQVTAQSVNKKYNYVTIQVLTAAGRYRSVGAEQTEKLSQSKHSVQWNMHQATVTLVYAYSSYSTYSTA